MQLYLLRHGIAEDGKPGLPDRERSLTAEGRRKLRHVLETASKAGMQPTLLLSSPLKRALQTAEIAKDVLGYKADIVPAKGLMPGSTVEQVWQEVREHRAQESLLLVGHNPLFGHLGAFLLGNMSMHLEFKKGAVLRIDLESFGAQPKGILRWYLTAKLAEGRP